MKQFNDSEISMSEGQADDSNEEMFLESTATSAEKTKFEAPDFDNFIASDRLKKAFSTLTPLQRECVNFQLGLTEYKTYTQLAKKLNINPAQVYMTIHKSKAVQDILEELAEVSISDWAAIMRVQVLRATQGDTKAAEFVAKYAGKDKTIGNKSQSDITQSMNIVSNILSN
jgi:hypothetical protein